MKRLTIIALLAIGALTSCKKESKPSLYGKWLAADGSTQFTIDNLQGKGKSNFVLKGDQLTWKFNDTITVVYKVIQVREATMTLNEEGIDKYFIRTYL